MGVGPFLNVDGSLAHCLGHIQIDRGAMAASIHFRMVDSFGCESSASSSRTFAILSSAFVVKTLLDISGIAVGEYPIPVQNARKSYNLRTGDSCGGQKSVVQG